MIMRRREFIALVGGAVAAWPLAARAQQPKRPSRIGTLHTGSDVSHRRVWGVFSEALRELGWIEGESFVLERRFTDGVERLSELAAALFKLNVDVIVASGDVATRYAKQATSTIPIVMASGGDAVGSGLVTSLGRPGGNVTGLSFLVSPEIGSKRLQLLKEVAPEIARVVVLWSPANSTSVLVVKDIESAAGSLGIKVHSVAVGSTADLENAFMLVAQQRPEALMSLVGPIIYSHRSQIADFAATNRLPSIHSLKEFVEAGGLMSYGSDFPDMYRRAARYVDKILKGAKPNDLPVEQPTKFELVINLKSAKALGLTIPPTLLARADEVIE